MILTFPLEREIVVFKHEGKEKKKGRKKNEPGLAFPTLISRSFQKGRTAPAKGNGRGGKKKKKGKKGERKEKRGGLSA